MLNLISKISPELKQSSSKIGAVLAFNDKFLCFIIDFIFIELLEYNKKNKNSVRLDGHLDSVKCLKFSKNNILISCSSDCLISWHISIENKPQKKIIAENCFRYEPTSLTIHPNNKLIAVSNAILIDLFDIETCSSLNQIKLNDCVNFFDFSLFDPSLLFISTQNNLLLCFDLEQNQITQSIQNTFSNSFLNITSHEYEPIILVSSTDGSINTYNINTKKFNFINKININKIYSDFLKQNTDLKQLSDIDKSNTVCTGLNLFHVNKQSIITYSTSNSIFLIDYESNDLIYLIDFKHVIFTNHPKSFLMPQSVDFCLCENKQINAALLLLFHNEIYLVKCADFLVNSSLDDDKHNSNNLAQPVQNDLLTVFPKCGLLKESPLNEQIIDKELNKTKLPSMQEYLRTNSLTKKNIISSKDKPVTFNSKIRSSGYNTTTVKREKFTPLINKDFRSSSLASLNSLVNESKMKQNISLGKIEQSEFKFEVPSVLNKKFNATDKSNPISLIKFSDDGHNLVLVSTDNIIQYLQSNYVDKSGQIFNGHNDSIRSVDISHDGKLLLSASNDKTCKLWSLRKPMELVLDIQSLKLTETNSLNFKKEINSASFYYVDKFLLIGCDKNLFLCKYFIDSNKNDIQRYLNNSFCKLIKKFELTFAQSVTCLSAINSFYSYIVLCGGTDKSIEVFDMNEARSCLTIHDAHNRPFHQLSQNQSEFNQLSYDIFLSNAVGDGIKLWDLRIAKCVAKYDNHINRCLPTKVSFSPDSNYIAAGSEDRSTLVYDLRMNGIIKKYGVFSDTVSCTQFNPKKSQLLCGTQDGKMYCYQTK